MLHLLLPNPLAFAPFCLPVVETFRRFGEAVPEGDVLAVPKNEALADSPRVSELKNQIEELIRKSK